MPPFSPTASTSACFRGTRAEWNSCCSMMPRSGAPRARMIPGIRAGQLYGYRVTGPFAPEHGLGFDPSKILLGPYGRAVAVPDGYSRQMASEYGGNDAICDEKRSGRPQQLRLGGRWSIAAPHRQHCHLWDACRWFHATCEFKRCLGAARDLFRWGARPNTASRHASSLCWFREPATFPFQRKTSRQQTSRLTLTYQPTNPAKEHECSGIE